MASSPTPTLHQACTAFERLVPLHLAADWDNVGLLVEPTHPPPLNAVLLTIDLTDAVLDEAIQLQASCIIAYHPLLFAPIQRLTNAEPNTRIALRALDQRIAVWSPPPAHDSIPGGVNDWLASALNPASSTPIQPHPDNPECGAGRLLHLHQPTDLETLQRRIAKHLSLQHLRLARANNNAPINTVALCAGAGGSVLQHTKADLYWTGEMRHHDVLAAQNADRHVILCEHTNTERGYLPTFAQNLSNELPHTTFHIAQTDRDPLQIIQP